MSFINFLDMLRYSTRLLRPSLAPLSIDNINLTPNASSLFIEKLSTNPHHLRLVKGSDTLEFIGKGYQQLANILPTSKNKNLKFKPFSQKCEKTDSILIFSHSTSSTLKISQDANQISLTQDQQTLLNVLLCTAGSIFLYNNKSKRDQKNKLYALWKHSDRTKFAAESVRSFIDNLELQNSFPSKHNRVHLGKFQLNKFSTFFDQDKLALNELVINAKHSGFPFVSQNEEDIIYFNKDDFVWQIHPNNLANMFRELDRSKQINLLQTYVLEKYLSRTEEGELPEELFTI